MGKGKGCREGRRTTRRRSRRRKKRRKERKWEGGMKKNGKRRKWRYGWWCVMTYVVVTLVGWCFNCDDDGGVYIAIVKVLGMVIR